MDELSAYYQKFPEIVDAVMAAVKRAQLKEQFLISKDPLYDYYSTNSGIFAANPTVGSGGGGDDPGDLEGRVTKNENDIKDLSGTVDGFDSRIAESEENSSLAKGMATTANTNSETALYAANSVSGMANDALSAAEEALSVVQDTQETTNAIKVGILNTKPVGTSQEDYADIYKVIDDVITNGENFETLRTAISGE